MKKAFTLITTRKRNVVSGFTLIELMVVVAILGVLATFVTVQFTGAQSRARDARRQSDLRQYQTSLEVYANRSNSLYLPTNGATVDISVSAQCTALQLVNCPTDPRASATMYYRYQSDAARTSYVLWAQLEKPNDTGQIENFVLCSTGNVGKIAGAVTVANGNCPL